MEDTNLEMKELNNVANVLKDAEYLALKIA